MQCKTIRVFKQACNGRQNGTHLHTRPVKLKECTESSHVGVLLTSGKYELGDSGGGTDTTGSKFSRFTFTHLWPPVGSRSKTLKRAVSSSKDWIVPFRPLKVGSLERPVITTSVPGASDSLPTSISFREVRAEIAGRS